ncbi:MAG TPA: hypothetical protein VKU83_11740, partial [Puia sp.]|nr:hypothetical protein [Puia sp.]
ERINRSGVKLTHIEDIRTLPAGTFIRSNDQPWLYSEGRLHLWTPFGYEAAISPPQSGAVEVLTPRSVVAAFRAGYKPQQAMAVQTQLR